MKAVGLFVGHCLRWNGGVIGTVEELLAQSLCLTSRNWYADLKDRFHTGAML
jgi:hypothetical protein